MKRILLVLALMAVVGMAWGQQIPFPSFVGLSSLESLVMQGLYFDEIDSSFQVDHGFGSVSNPFLVAGVLGNPLLAANNGALTTLDLGYYQNGGFPYSGLLTATATNRANPIPNTSSVPSLNNTVNVVSGITTTSYLWSTTVTNTTFSLPSAINAFNGTAQGLFQIAGITTGLSATYNPNWTTTDTAAAAGYYADQLVTHNYNTAAAGVIPVQTLDYTVETKTQNINSAVLPAPGASGVYATTSNLAFAIPSI